MITRKITMKKGTTEKQLTNFSNWLDSKGKFLANGQDENGNYYIICRFDDEVDLLAFLYYISSKKEIKTIYQMYHNNERYL